MGPRARNALTGNGLRAKCRWGLLMERYVDDEALPSAAIRPIDLPKVCAVCTILLRNGPRGHDSRRPVPAQVRHMVVRTRAADSLHRSALFKSPNAS